jgi:hypothetical protein
MPEGLNLISASEVPLNAPSLMSHISAESYRAYLADMPQHAGAVAERAAALMAGGELWVERENKKGRSRRMNIRPLIKELRASSEPEDKSVAVDMLLLYQEGSKPHPEEILATLLPEIEPESWSLCKIESFVELDGQLANPLEVAEEETVYA